MPKRMGPPPIVLPQELIDALDSTYDSGQADTAEVDSVEEVDEFIRYSKLHAKRRELSFRSKLSPDSKNLEFQMTDKRPYRKSTLTREK